MDIYELMEKCANNKTKVSVAFAGGNKKWGWIHKYNNRYWLTRGNKIGFSMDTAISIKEII